MIKRLLCATALALAPATAALAHDNSGGQVKATLVYDHVLPNVPGKSIKAVMVEYAPGANSPAPAAAPVPNPPPDGSALSEPVKIAPPSAKASGKDRK